MKKQDSHLFFPADRQTMGRAGRTVPAARCVYGSAVTGQSRGARLAAVCPAEVSASWAATGRGDIYGMSMRECAEPRRGTGHGMNGPVHSVEN